MTRLSRSVHAVLALLEGADLANEAAVGVLLQLTNDRRRLDLSDLSPDEQAALIEERSQELHPSAKALAERIMNAQRDDRGFIAKFGIDPTGREIHLGHVVPMLILSRFQRMGHEVVFIVGDVTAKIGDPSGRSHERPPLTDEDIDYNLATYRMQVMPFFDFFNARFLRNGQWLRRVTLPELIEVTAHIPVSAPLQREDFRKRLGTHGGLSIAELLYSVVMALDSVEINCDVEVGGIDQLLNMQMCRRVMAIRGQDPELIVATPIIEGTDGTGAKMSKSKGNYVPLTAPPGEMFGKIMSVPDRLVEPWFKALSEWRDVELGVVRERLEGGSLHPMDLKKILAGEVTAAVHGVDAAMKAREEFVAQFSARSFGEVEDLPVVADVSRTVAEVVRALGFAKSNGDVRRVAQQNGLRIVVEREGGQDAFVLTTDDVYQPLAAVIKDRVGDPAGALLHLKVGRKLARLPAL